MFCQNCGSSIDSNAEFCVNCGSKVNTFTQKSPTNQVHIIDKPNTLVNILSLCCIPILGIILYFVWKDKQPIAAKSALTFSLISIGLIVVFYIVIFVFGLAFSTY